jgi:phosphoenolpyruvate carboxylase
MSHKPTTWMLVAWQTMWLVLTLAALWLRVAQAYEPPKLKLYKGIRTFTVTETVRVEADSLEQAKKLINADDASVSIVEDAQTHYQVEWVGEYDLSYKGKK